MGELCAVRHLRIKRNTMRTKRLSHSLSSASAWAAAAALATALSGCHLFHKAAPVAVKPKAPARVAMLPLDLTKVQPNEAGLVPILEYHDLTAGDKIKEYAFPASEFRRDVEWLYAHNYRPISLSDYVQGKIDCPAGTSPVILTFDDALRGQFRFTPDGKVDPECAVGILDAMHQQHADWPLKGTFFVLTDQDPKNPPPFYQADSAQSKMEYLVKDGFEIGDHTVHHWKHMNRWDDAKVQSEIAGGVAGIHKYLPTYNVQTLALPGGVFPRHKKLVVSGASGGVTYHHICALKAGWDPAPSPLARKVNMYSLPRIIPADARTKPGGLATIRYWLAKMERNKADKFVSDGDPITYTVSVMTKGRLDTARLQKEHFFLRTYSGTQLMAQK